MRRNMRCAQWVDVRRNPRCAQWGDVRRNLSVNGWNGHGIAEMRLESLAVPSTGKFPYHVSLFVHANLYASGDSPEVIDTKAPL